MDRVRGIDTTFGDSDGGPTQERGGLLPFSRGRELASKREALAQRQVALPEEKTARERLLHAVEIEKRGFLEGSIVLLRRLHEEVEIESDPLLAISTRYFLASFLMLAGERKEAHPLAEDGLLLAWEHEATEELELLEALCDQLER